MSENMDAYKDFLDNPIDLEKELKTAGPAANDELLKNVDIPEDIPAILLADKQTEFWKNSLKDIEAEVKKLELQKQQENPQEQQGQQNQQETQKKEDQILFHIQIVKEISVRNEKIKKVLDTNKELTQEQINSLNAELTANQELLNYENKERIKEAMEIRVQKVIMMKYVELYGEAELKKARELGNAAKKDFLAKRQEAGL